MIFSFLRTIIFLFKNKFFKRKKKKIEDQLELALGQGVITEEEVLKLRVDRAENELKDFLKSKK